MSTWRWERLARIDADEARWSAEYADGSTWRAFADVNIAARRLGVEVVTALRIPELADWLTRRLEGRD